MNAAVQPSTPATFSSTASLQKVQHHMLCHICRKWMAPEEILSCVCHLTCKYCAKDSPNCSQCGQKMARDAKVEQFYRRLSQIIPHRCCYSRHGCQAVASPEIAHEETCVFKPIHCLACDDPVLRHELFAHFELAHPGKKVLTENNHTILLSEFVYSEFSFSQESFDAKIYCMVQGQCFLINIINNQSDVEDSILLISPIFADDGAVVCAKFEFKLKGYSCKKSITFGKANSSSEKVSKDTIKDWVEGYSLLDINIVVRKKRKVDNK